MNLSKFAERLSEIMFDAKMSSRALSQELGCSKTTVNRYLSCAREPTVEILVKMADYFHCSTDFLLGLENENYATHFGVCPPFNEQFRMLLKQCEISQYKLEKDTQIAHSSMVFWKNGTKQPSVSSVVRIARALGKTVDFVLGRTSL